MATTTESFTAGAGQVLYPFTIQYIQQSDLKVAINGVDTTAYTFANATTIQLDSAPTTGAEVVIRRLTSVDTIDSTFFPGSSIRAQDLNDNFQQLLLSSQELADKVPLVNAVFPDDVSLGNNQINNLADPTAAQDAVNKQFLESSTWDTTSETIDSNEVWPGTDSNIATTGAIDGRIDAKIDQALTNDIAGQDGVSIGDDGDGTITVGLNDGQVDLSKIKNSDVDISSDSWSNNDITIATTAKIDDVIDDAIENDVLIDSTGLTKSASNGRIVLGVGQNSVDLDRIKQADIINTANYASNWSSDDTKVATAGAIALRHDLVLSPSAPTNAQPGKLWFNTTVDVASLNIWDGSAWQVVTSGTPYIPQGTTIVRYVDAVNGSDEASRSGFLPQSPLKTIKRALTLVNASSSGDGTLIVVEPGVYQEALPLTIEKNNVSVVGKSLRSCFIHPTVATENNNMWEVDSGTYISGFTLLGLKVPTTDQGSRNNSIDNDATYGLPSNQPFAVSFRSGNPVILKSPYIQNCTHFSDAHFDNANFDPNTFPSTDSQTFSAVAGDQTSAPCGGGLLVDGSVPASTSPIRSMVVDAFTQITLDGPGILVTNNGYAQLVSFFGTFCHYHAKAKNGGQINLSNCVTDFGRYGLIAEGKSPVAIASATATPANSGATTVTIGAITSAASFHGTVSRPLDHMMLTIDGNDYGVLNSVANGSGWDVNITPALSSNITNTAVSFALRSYISTGGHTFEYVGVGTDYSDHPDNGGVAVEANQVTQINGGRVWQSSTDHIGKFKAGSTLIVDQVADTVALKTTSVTGNITVTGTVDGRDVATDGTKLDGIEAGATADQTNAEIRAAVEAASDSNVFTDADHTKLDGIATGAIANIVEDNTPQLGGNLDVNGKDITSTSNGNITLDPNGTGSVVFKGNSGSGGNGAGRFVLNCENNSHGITIQGPPHSAGANYTLTLPDNDGGSGQILETDGSGNLTWVSAAAGYSDTNVDSHLNTSTASSGELLSWNGSDYDWISAAAGYSDSSVDSHLNRSTAATGEVLSFNGSDYDWVTQATGGLTNNSNQTGSLGVGTNALNSETSGSDNTAFGNAAMQSKTSGEKNTAIGSQALLSITTDNDSTAVGCNALRSATGGNNTAVGTSAGFQPTTGTLNAYFGWMSGFGASGASGGQNTFVGAMAGYGIGSGGLNTAAGYQALYSNTTGTCNVALGSSALRSNTTASNNVAIGYQAGKEITTASGNTFVGYESGKANTSGTSNTFIGFGTGQSVTTASENTFVGAGVGGSVTTGSSNTAMGRSNMNLLTTGNSNVSIGSATLENVTTGGGNVCVGNNAGQSITDHTGNSYFGDTAGRYQTGASNVAVGIYALYGSSGSSNGDNNVAVGYGSLWKNTTGSNNVSSGYQALNQNTTGFDNSALGAGSLKANTSGYRNVAIGSGTLEDSTTASNNTGVGYECLKNCTGSENLAIGAEAGDALTSGSNNIIIGTGSDASSQTVSNELTIGNGSINTFRCNTQSISSLSDGRDKIEVEDLPLGLDFIDTLRPVKFKWDTRDGNIKDGSYEAGFIAQDLQSAQSTSNADYLKMVMDENPDRLEAAYGQLIPVLVQAIKDLKSEIETLKSND